MPREAPKADIRSRLLASFSSLAGEKSYFDLTVNEIAGQAGISASSFYTYYRSKDELLSHYMDDSLLRLEKALSLVDAGRLDVATAVRISLYTLSTLLDDPYLQGFHRVFRELEFIDGDLAAQYYKRLLSMVNNVLEEVELLESSIPREAVSTAIVGSSQFIYLFRRIFEIPGSMSLDIEVAGDLILKGLGCRKARYPEPSWRPVAAPLLEELAERYGAYESVAGGGAREKILRAALRVFSRKSFRDAKVFEICGEAGYSVGMFYKAYSSKNELLSDTIKLMGKVVRRFLTECVSGAANPLEREVSGLSCFLSFVERNGQIYRVVRESEYIDPNITKMYYGPFMERYRDRLAREAERGEIISYSPESLAITLMGINHLAGIVGPLYRVVESVEALARGLAKIYSGGVLGAWA